MDKAMEFLMVGLGSALGGIGRFWIAGWIGQRLGEGFPWGTIVVNVTGSFAIGMLGAFAATDGRVTPKPGLPAAHFLMAGICGGYTTFSAFSLQTLKLIQAGSLPQAGANVALSVTACLIAVWLGYLAGQALRR